MSAAPMNAAPASAPWFKSYPEGVPHTIDVGAIGTLVDRINHSFTSYAANGAFESFGKTLTYDEIGKQSRAFAAWLQSRGMKKGDRVALMMPNVMAYPIALFGVLLAGCTVVNVNPLYTPRELTHQLKDSGARIIVALENFAHVVEETLADVKLDQVVIASVGDSLGLKGFIINLVARHIKKVVPPYSIPGALSF
ncbi:MAG: AMP-binding protein, partial [Beijerinckiaceae bacterium]